MVKYLLTLLLVVASFSAKAQDTLRYTSSNQQEIHLFDSTEADYNYTITLSLYMDKDSVKHVSMQGDIDGAFRKATFTLGPKLSSYKKGDVLSVVYSCTRDDMFMQGGTFVIAKDRGEVVILGFGDELTITLYLIDKKIEQTKL